MFTTLSLERHHIFLLCTAIYHAAKVQVSRTMLIVMTIRTTSFVVAVVDDDKSILQSFELLLDSADYAVRTFSSATAFLDSNSLEESDCLILDIDMPGSDGFDLVKLVQAARPQLPIFLISGLPDQQAQLPSLRGFKPRLFLKPFQGHELLEALSDALRSPHG